MPELQAYHNQCIDRFRNDLSPTAQAQLIIPMGTVEQSRRHFENIISQHPNERDPIHIHRALRNVDDLIRQGRTYAGQLRDIETLGLSHLPTHLISFLRNHDNMYRAAIRARRVADTATVDLNSGVLERIQLRIANLNTLYSINIIQHTWSPAAWRKMKQSGVFDRECLELTKDLQNEIVHILTSLERVLPDFYEEVRYENIGPDHNVNDFGYVIDLPWSIEAPKLDSGLDEHDEKLTCCICLEAYTPSHQSFLVSQCGHVIGRLCLEKWLNSTSCNSNLCPQCRAPLCERRPRRPVASNTQEDMRMMMTQLQFAGDLLRAVAEVWGNLEGVEAKKERFGHAVQDLNEMFFLQGVGFVFLADNNLEDGWRLRRADWGSAQIIEQLFFR